MSFLYIIKTIDLIPTRYKIGISHTPETRFKQLKTASPVPLKISGYIKVNDARGLESRLHDFFEIKRVHGEWFILGDLEFVYLENIANAIVNAKSSETEETILKELDYMLDNDISIEDLETIYNDNKVLTP